MACYFHMHFSLAAIPAGTDLLPLCYVLLRLWATDPLNQLPQFLNNNHANETKSFRALNIWKQPCRGVALTCHEWTTKREAKTIAPHSHVKHEPWTPTFESFENDMPTVEVQLVAYDTFTLMLCRHTLMTRQSRKEIIRAWMELEIHNKIRCTIQTQKTALKASTRKQLNAFLIHNSP